MRRGASIKYVDMFKRKEYQLIESRLESETNKFIQVITGPGQVGITTVIK